MLESWMKLLTRIIEIVDVTVRLVGFVVVVV